MDGHVVKRHRDLKPHNKLSSDQLEGITGPQLPDPKAANGSGPLGLAQNAQDWSGKGPEAQLWVFTKDLSRNQEASATVLARESQGPVMSGPLPL